MGGKSWQHLTEDEREERRLRRILANRESALRTIWRRETTLRELRQKTADLEMLNENLKKEREVAKSDYNLLKNTSERLKARIDDEMMKRQAMVMMKEKEKEKLEQRNAESAKTSPSRVVVSEQSSSGPNWRLFPVLAPMWMTNVEQMNSALSAHPAGAFVYVLPAVPLLYPFLPPAPINTHLVPNDYLVHELGAASCPCILANQEEAAEGSNPCEFEDDSELGLKNDVKQPCHTADFETEKNEELRKEFPSNIRVADPLAAAKSRKRRKELMKLKKSIFGLEN